MNKWVLRLKPLVDLNEYIGAERTNKFLAAKVKKTFTGYVALECKAQKLPALQRITKIVFIWKHRNRRKDMDNVEFGQKFIWDGLVLGGIVKSDGWLHRPATTIHKHLVDSKNPGCEVIIEGETEKNDL